MLTELRRCTWSVYYNSCNVGDIKWVEMTEQQWSHLGILAAWFQVIVILAAAGYAAFQVREMKKQRAIAISIPIFQSLGSPEAVLIRRRLYNDIRTDQPETLDLDEQDLINSIVNQLDFLGFAVEQGLIDERQVVSFYYGTVIRCWHSCGPYVRWQRALRGTQFAQFFEKLFRRCQSYVGNERNGEAIRTYRQ